jgi:hypothetical protein
VVGIAIGAAANGGSKNSPAASGSASTASSVAAPASSAAAPAAAAPKTSAAPAAPPAAAKSVVLQTSGEGEKTTKQFTVADNWSVKYTYDCASLGFKGNFVISEDGGELSGLPIVNELGDKGSDTTYKHDDAGQRSLEINSECSWSVTVTSGDAG